MKVPTTSEARAESTAMAALKSTQGQRRGEGHGKERCWFLHPELKPEWWKEKEQDLAQAMRKGQNPKGEKPRGFVAETTKTRGVEEASQKEKEREVNDSDSGSTSTQISSLLAQITGLLSREGLSKNLTIYLNIRDENGQEPKYIIS